MKQYSKVIALATLGLSVGSCGEIEGPTADPNDIHVIVVMPFTGSFRSRSEVHRTAIQMAFRDLTEAHAVGDHGETESELLPGRSIRAWEIDATRDADECERRVRELIDERLTDADGRPMVAAIMSTTTAAFTGSLRVALDLRIPHFELSSGSHYDEFILREDFPDPADYAQHTSFSFASRPLCMQEAVMTADFIASRPEWQRIALARGTRVHDQMHTRVIRERLAVLADPDDPDNPMRDAPWRGEIVNAEDHVMEYGSNWSEHLDAITGMDVDAFFFHLNGDDNNFDFLEQARLAEVEPAIVTCNMAEKSELLDPINPGIGDWLAGRLWFVGRRPRGSDLVAQWREAYTQFSGLSGDRWTPGAYDAAMILGLALLAPGAAEGGEPLRDAILQVASGGTPVDYGNIRLAAELARAGMDIDYQGVSGSMDFREDHTIPGEFMVDRVNWDAAANQGSYSTLETPAPRQL